MYNFISGKYNNGKELKQFFILAPSVRITHAEMLQLVPTLRVENAGYVDISEHGWVSFYGKSDSIGRNVEGMDIQTLNQFLKGNLLFEVDADDVQVPVYVSDIGILGPWDYNSGWCHDKDDTFNMVNLRERYFELLNEETV